MRNKAEIDTTVRAAMERYKEKVLDHRYFNAETEVYDYPFRVTAGEVLKMAGKVSRATLLKDYHEELRTDLGKFIEDLKRKTGKRTQAEAAEADASDAAAEGAARATSSINRLTQMIATLQYRILSLERENAILKGKLKSKVVSLPTAGNGRR